MLTKSGSYKTPKSVIIEIYHQIAQAASNEINNIFSLIDDLQNQNKTNTSLLNQAKVNIDLSNQNEINEEQTLIIQPINSQSSTASP